MNGIVEILKHRSFRLSMLLTIVYFGIGLAVLHFDLSDYGWVLFVIFPFSIGFAVGSMERRKWAYLGLVFGILIFFTLLILGGLEGMVCILMSIPIIAPLVWFGTAFHNEFVKRGILKNRNNLKVLLLPLLVLLFGGPLE